MHFLFVPIYDFFKRRKPIFWFVFLVSMALWSVLAFNIKLEEDLSSMLPDSESVRTMNDVIGSTEAGEQVIFLVSHTDTIYNNPDSLIVAANAFTHILENQFNEYIDTVLLQPANNYEQELVNVVQKNLPLFLEDGDYGKIDSLLTESKIEQTLKNNKKILLSPASVFYKRLVAKDPIGISNVVWTKLKKLQVDKNYDLYDGYLVNKKQNQLTFFIKPKYKANETGKNAKFFESLDNTISEWQKDNKGIVVKYFGASAVAAGNAIQMRTDTIVTLSVTIVLLLLTTLYFFRRKRIPLLLLLPVLYGGLMGIGIISIVQDSISVIALGAGAIIMGIAIDFSIHFLTHVRKSGDIRTSIKELSQPLTLGSFTTVAAFLSLRFVDTPILQDLGLFAATSLLGAALCTLIFLPHMPLGIANAVQAKVTLFDRVAQLKPERNKWLLIVIVLLTPVMFYFSSNVQFDSDLMNLNYMSPELRSAQKDISATNPDVLRSIYIIAEGENEEVALNKLNSISKDVTKLESTGVVNNAISPTMLLVDRKTQQERLEKWYVYWQEKNIDKISNNIISVAKSIGFSSKAFSKFTESLSREYTLLDEGSESLIKSLFPNGFAENNGKHYALGTLKTSVENRKAVFDAFTDVENVTITDKQEGATQLISILNNDFTDIALYSSFIVFFALLLGYGRIELALTAFLPMAISWIWILGLMSLLGLKFNIVNIIISSLIFGLGDDYAIFTMDGLVERYRTGRSKLSSVRAAVYLSAVTAFIGLGVLLLAKHPALRSIAFISVTGLLCVLLISQILQPFLFNWFIQHRADRKFQPFTIRSFAITIFLFVYFAIGSLVLTVLGFILTKLWPNRNQGKSLFHKLIYGFVSVMPFLKYKLKAKKYILGKEKFDKPAIIIANHTSFLDILLMVMLHPKLVLLTNRWVWNSPVFGAVVRMAEYYPVADGADNSLEHIETLTQRGYSVVIFPEGTRSLTDRIGRFHKGAFFIAEKLKLDLLPVLIHGAHNALQKNDWLLKEGTCSVYVHDRITPDDNKFGTSYQERAKSLGKWMRNRLDEVKVTDETPSKFKERLIRTYTYKGPVLEWYCRVKIKLENYYEPFHELLPRKGQFYDLGCGYGFMTYMLHWSAQDRKFTGIDYDEEKIITANNNCLRDDKVNFIHADLTKIELSKCDGVIISDVLHYLLPEQQDELLEKSLNALNEGGLIIIRDGVSDLKDRIKGTKLTELFSTKILRFNKTQNALYYLNKSTLEEFALKNKLKFEVIDNAKMTANLTFVLTK